MKFLWFIDKDNDIWRFSNDYSYTIYFKDGNYKENNTFKVTKEDIKYYNRAYKLKEISEVDVFLEML